MNQIFERKKEIRKKIDVLRRSKTLGWIVEHSAAVVAKLEAQPFFQRAAIVHTYVSWRNEVSTHELIRSMLKQEKTVVVPRIEGAAGTLAHARIQSLSDLKPGAYGIPEPPQPVEAYDLSQIEVVLVPGVAFDRMGYRLGFGGGYYDAFLTQMDALRVGLAFDLQLVDEVPRRAEDEKVDIIVTETGILRP